MQGVLASIIFFIKIKGSKTRDSSTRSYPTVYSHLSTKQMTPPQNILSNFVFSTVFCSLARVALKELINDGEILFP